MIVKRLMQGVTAGLLGLLVVMGCATIAASTAETTGERFERAMKEIAAACASRKLAPNEVCGEVTKLKPADPLATPDGRFAHSIKIPNPVPTDSGYKPGMTPQEYFDHLCKTEAGEFIYRTVENIEGIYMLRPRKEASDYELQHLYALEDPYGQTTDETYKPEDSYVQPALGKYQFLEMPFPETAKESNSAKYRRYYRDPNAHPGRDYPTAVDGRFVRVPYIVTEKPVDGLQSRYGYTWRGIKRPHDRELGIAGGELIVLDVQTYEVLAMRRGFIRSGDVRNNLTGVWWLGGHVCPGVGGKRGHLFIKEVLRPLPMQSVIREK